MNITRFSKLAVSLVLGVAFAIPALPQGGENNDWTAIQDQRDGHRRMELLDAFIKKYPSSGRRPDADFMLIDLYSGNKDYQKIIQLSEDYRQRPPSGDPAAKTKIFFSAMFAAASLNDVKRTSEYGEEALRADPNNFAVLSFMAAANLPNPQKAMEYAQKALTLPKPPTMQPEAYATNIGRLHGIVAVPLFGEGKFKEAREHLEFAIKANPKDQATHYRYGYATISMMTAAAGTAREANDSYLKAMADKKTEEAEAAKQKMENASKEALELRDVALESMARALAVGGQLTPQAKQLFDNLYQNKNRSLDGADQLIAQKKAELGL